MKTSLAVLSKEHENILKVAAALNKECEAIRKGKGIDKEFFSNAIDFIRNYADKFHHAKEEEILFVELCKGEVQERMHCNPIEQMKFEHVMGRDFVKGMDAGVKENDKKKVVENAEGYAALIQEHIFKEDNVLFPMADEALDSKSEKSILKRYDVAEKKVGAGVKKYVDFANKLK